MLLAIDTSAGTSVAVVDGFTVVAEASSDDTRRHAEMVGDLIVAALERSGVPVAALDGVVAGMGPGPFTGLRVGIAAARAFAWGAGIGVVPIVSHDALALQAWRDGAPGELIVVSDARRRELFWSRYAASDGTLAPDRIGGPGLVAADGVDALVAGFPASGLVRAATVSAGALGIVAAARQKEGLPAEPDAAIYLRSPDVTIAAGPKRVTS